MARLTELEGIARQNEVLLRRILNKDSTYKREDLLRAYDVRDHLDAAAIRFRFDTDHNHRYKVLQKLYLYSSILPMLLRLLPSSPRLLLLP